MTSLLYRRAWRHRVGRQEGAPQRTQTCVETREVPGQVDKAEATGLRVGVRVPKNGYLRWN